MTGLEFAATEAILVNFSLGSATVAVLAFQRLARSNRGKPATGQERACLRP